LPVTGELVWIIGEEMGIKLKKRISPDVIKAELNNFEPDD
jgi:hypothetical protein